MRLLLEEPDVKRFRISQEDLPVVDEQLIATDLTDKVQWDEDGQGFTISGLEHESGDESFSYHVELSRFRINQVSENGKSLRTLVVNPEDTLYYESEAAVALPHMYSANA